MTSTAQKKQIKAYQELTVDEQRILEVLSVIYEPIIQTTLHKVLKQLGWKSTKNSLLSSLLNKKLRDKFISKKLITYDNNVLACHPNIIHTLTASTLKSDTFKEIHKAAEKITPCATYFIDAYDQLDSLYLKRPLRNALFLGNIIKVKRFLNIQNDLFHTNPSAIEALIEIIGWPIHIEHIDFFKNDIQILILTLAIKLSDHTFSFNQTLFNYFSQLCGKQKKLPEISRYHLIEQKLLRGELESAKNLIEKDHSDQNLGLLGSYYVLTGQYETAITHYQAALTAKNKDNSKLHLASRSGVFFFLALLASGKKHMLLQYLQNAAKSPIFEYDAFSPSMIMITNVSKIFLGTGTLELAQINSEAVLQMSNAPFLHWVNDVSLYWLGEKNKILDPNKLANYCKTADEQGYYWYAYEYASLLHAIGELKDCQPILTKLENNTNYTSLLSSIEPTEPWQRKLEVLKGLPNINTTDEQDMRLIWSLTLSNSNSELQCKLQPKEQKRNKKGGWSKGRKISLRRLYEEPEQFKHLSPQDEKLRQTIHINENYHFFGYHKDSFSISGEKALLAAVGHPLIFWEEDLHKPIEILQGEPELFITENQEHVELQIQPNPTHAKYYSESLVIEKEHTHRLRLVEFNTQHAHIASLLGEEGLKVPIDAKEQVIDSITAITQILTIHSDIAGQNQAAKKIVADSKIHVHLQPFEQGLQMQWYVKPFTTGGPLFSPGHGGTSVFAEIEGEKLQANRDLTQEKSTTDQMIQDNPVLSAELEDNPHHYEWNLSDPEQALETLHYLKANEDTVTIHWPQGKSIKLSREVSHEEMQVTIRKKRDWFELSAELHIDEDTILSTQRLYELINSSPGRFIKLENDSFLVLTKELQKKLNQLKNYADEGQFHALASHAIEEITDGMQIKSHQDWKKQLKRFNEAQQLNFIPPKTLKAQLRDYQNDGFQWLCRLAHLGMGACLADDMGLGKTLQALSLILTRAADGPTLVLAPSSVCINWLDETKRFAPTLNAQRFGVGDRQEMLNQTQAFDLIICSYGLLQSEIERLKEIQWHTIVADEAQAIKNPHAKRTQAAMALTGDFKIATTGTPIENHLGELWTLFRFINPGLLGSLERFNQRFAHPIENIQDPIAKEQLKKLTQPFILRRMKNDVLTELPPKTDIIIHVELSKEETLFYETLRREALKRMEMPEENAGQQKLKILAELTRLRRACCNPSLVMPKAKIPSSKLQAFDNILNELLENKHKALVFSQFVGHLTLIRNHLEEKGIKYQYLDGRTSNKQRKTAVDTFQAGEGDIFLISLKAGGVGLNLTAADYVIHMDPWWNPAVEDQASDRAHRMGQQKPVTVYRLVTTNTIEDKIVDLHEHKRDLANSLLDNSEFSGKLSVEDMMNLIAN